MASRRADQPWTILGLSILPQTRRQFHQPLLIMLIAAIAYVDLKVAFDTVDKKIPGQPLKEISLPEKIVSILAEWLVSHQMWRLAQGRI